MAYLLTKSLPFLPKPHLIPFFNPSVAIFLVPVNIPPVNSNSPANGTELNTVFHTLYARLVSAWFLVCHS